MVPGDNNFSSPVPSRAWSIWEALKSAQSQVTSLVFTQVGLEQLREILNCG